MGKRIASAFLFLLAGALLGPALFYAVADIWEQHAERADPLFAGESLVEVYDSHNLPTERRYHQVALDETARDCGYDIDTLAPDGAINPRITLNPKHSTKWTPNTGYEDLLTFKAERREWLTRLGRGRLLAAQISPYGISFLEDCISKTALSPICTGYVRSILRTRHYDVDDISPPSVDMSREKTTICTYLDGLAARAGMTLPVRQ